MKVEDVTFFLKQAVELAYENAQKGGRPFGAVLVNNNSVHDKFHRTLILSGICLLKIARISLNSSFFPKPIKR